MAQVKDLLEAKKDEINHSVVGTANVLQALVIMAKANVSAVLVTEGEQIVGIFTERDYIRKGELKGHSASETRVQDLMTGDMITVATSTSVDHCMGLMMKHRIRHLPVVDENMLIGIVSMRDVVDVVLTDKESMIKGLENYIMGTGFAT